MVQVMRTQETSAQALISLLRAWLTQVPCPPTVTSPVAAAQAHRLAGWLYHTRAPMGEFEALPCQRAWADALGAHLMRVECLQRIWPREAPPPLVFKGADLGEHLYGDPGARQARDLDLLVPPAALPGLVRHLAPLADRVERPRHERAAHDAEHAVGLRFGPVLIEFHAHPWPPHRGGPDGWVLWTRGRPTTLGDLPVLMPSPADRLLLWLGNLTKGGFFSDLADLLDLALILKAAPEGDEARAVGLGLAYEVGCLRLAALGLPPTGWTAPTPQARLLNRCLPAITLPRGEPPRLRAQLLKIWLADPAARAGVLTRMATTWLRGSVANSASKN